MNQKAPVAEKDYRFFERRALVNSSETLATVGDVCCTGILG